MKNKIHFISTGGTIDGFYDAAQQTARPAKKSGIPAYIKDMVKPYGAFTFETVCMKDSNDITDTDRKKMAAAVKKSKADKIIITHGTDTMAKTADFLKKSLGKDLDKTVMLTGSLIPLVGFSGSDSGFNLGYACAEVTRTPPGVYVSMHATIFKAGKTAKNFKKARFEAKK